MALFLIFETIATFIVINLLSKLISRNPPPIYGHYSQKTSFYRIKKWLVYVYQRVFAKRESLLTTWNPDKDPSISGYGIGPSAEEDEIEFRKDGVDVCCWDKNGNALIAGVDYDDGTQWLFMRIKHENELQTLRLPLHPNASTTSSVSTQLNFQPIEPFRKWKIAFNGFLRKGQNDEESETIVNGNLKLLWTPICQNLVNSKDHKNNWLLAKAIAIERWTFGFWRKFADHPRPEWHEQWGVLEGKLKCDGIDQEIHLYLKGKKRRTNNAGISIDVHKSVVFDIYANDGTVIHFSSESSPHGLTENSFGYVIFCNSEYETLNDCNFSLPHFAENKIIPDILNLKFKTEKRDYDVQMTIDVTPSFQLLESVKRNLDTKYYSVKVTVNGIDGNGVLRVTYPNELKSSVVVHGASTLLQETRAIDENLLAVKLSDVNCRDGNFVGGKAMSLGLMTTIKSNNFTIPKGICITVAAYWKHLNANTELLKNIENLRRVCAAALNDISSLQSECDSVVESISKVEVLPEIKEAVKHILDELFGHSFNEKRFAVRSSAVGEDGEETSSAGQNETFLGVKGEDNIYEAISKCWASQFTFQAVRYRRQHGQLISCGIGVVIQEMVNSQVAGVLFTREPVDGNVSKMLITASYGLGESVVSGLCDPDTVYVKRTWRDEVSIDQIHLGKKETQMTMNESSSGIRKDETSSEQMSTCCVKDDEALRLAQVGILLENVFGSPRDVEWAFSDGQLYLLQSRAITNLDRDSDWWITNEFNSATKSDDEVYTSANVREVMPGAVSPLSQSFTLPFLDVALNVNHRISPFVMRHLTWQYFGYFGWNTLLNLTNVFFVGVSRKLSSQNIGIGHSILGSNIYSGGLHEVLLHRYGEISKSATLEAILPAIKIIMYGDSYFESECKKIIAKARRELDLSKCNDALDIYSTIQRDVSNFLNIISHHVTASSGSSVFTGFMIAVLTARQEEFTTEHLEDISILLANCSNVVSANVPASIEKLIESVAALPQEIKDFIKNSSTEEVLKWLQDDKGHAGQEFQTFMSTHGHRGFRELDFHSTTWANNPNALIHSIQTALKSDHVAREAKKPETITETVNKLTTRLPTISKFILRKMLNKSREAVAIRELMKSHLALVTDLYRKAFKTLGTKMVEEGRLPDSDLIFFLTNYELGRLLRTRSAKLISTAVQRKAMKPQLEKIQFPSLIYGTPKLKFDDGNENLERESDFVLKGTCASRGKCSGVARVVQSINEANSIQAGDILITYATDICWSPYFPLLSGIVTEIGGLVSHGAVVAREYGLPCLIAAENATKMFRSGDNVILDASKGTISLISSDSK